MVREEHLPRLPSISIGVGGRRQEPLKQCLRMALFFFAHGSPKAAATCGDCYNFADSGKTFEIHVISMRLVNLIHCMSMTAFLV